MGLSQSAAESGLPLTTIQRLTGWPPWAPLRGVAVDLGEQEVGMHYVAVAVATGSPRAALATSGSVPRMCRG